MLTRHASDKSDKPHVVTPHSIKHYNKRDLIRLWIATNNLPAMIMNNSPEIRYVTSFIITVRKCFIVNKQKAIMIAASCELIAVSCKNELWAVLYM